MKMVSAKNASKFGCVSGQFHIFGNGIIYIFIELFIWINISTKRRFYYMWTYYNVNIIGVKINSNNILLI
jgi:hypothetical protein